MTRRSLLAALVAAASPTAAALPENWPCFRGLRGDGTVLDKDLPVTWSATENIAWKTALPGKGHASPIVWSDRIFLVSAVEETQERLLLCLDRKSGRILWQKAALNSPPERVHPSNSRASSTPATDGQRVYVSFLDRDRMFIAAYTLGGEKAWEARPGPFASVHGYSSSPVLYKDKLLVNGDHDGKGFLVALDAKTGAVAWKTERPNNTRSYCTPLIRTVGGRAQVMLSGSGCVASYSPDDGKLQWLMNGPTSEFVAAPVYRDNLLFITGGYPERHILAIKADGSGQIGEEQIAWRTRRGVAYVPSPVLVGEHLYVVADSGLLTCFQAKTGDVLWSERVNGAFSASPLATSDRLYLQNERGVTTVLKPGPTFQKLAENDLGEATMASPIASQGQLLIRGAAHLYSIGVGK